MEWIKISERLPEDIGHYLVYYKECDIGCIAWSFYNSLGQWASSYNTFYEDITHWMPLPEPPKANS